MIADTLRLVFRNVANGLTAINVLDPAPAVTALEVETVMDSVLDKNVFVTSGGDLVSKVRAEVVSRTVEVISEF